MRASDPARDPPWGEPTAELKEAHHGTQRVYRFREEGHWATRDQPQSSPASACKIVSTGQTSSPSGEVSEDQT